MPIILSALGVGCTPSKTASPRAASTEATPDSEQQPAPEAEPGGPLIVGGSFGLREVGLDGRPVRLLSATPAQRPRLLPGGGVLFLASEGRELRVFERDTGKERTVALLPSEFGSCPPGRPLRLEDPSVQADHDFVLDIRGDAACIRLQDRNDNMMSIAVDIRIQLPGGGVAYEISYPVECSRGTPVPPCQAGGTPPPRADPAQRPFSVQDGALLRHAPDAQNVVPLPPGDWSESVSSPSGRWILVEGNFHDGDYIYRSLLLLDAQEGALYPVGEGDISTPLTPQQLNKFGSGSVPTKTAVAEATVRWLRGSDVLIVGSLLVSPGHSGTDLGGDVAQ